MRVARPMTAGRLRLAQATCIGQTAQLLDPGAPLRSTLASQSRSRPPSPPATTSAGECSRSEPLPRMPLGWRDAGHEISGRLQGRSLSRSSAAAVITTTGHGWLSDSTRAGCAVTPTVHLRFFPSGELPESHPLCAQGTPSACSAPHAVPDYPCSPPMNAGG